MVLKIVTGKTLKTSYVDAQLPAVLFWKGESVLLPHDGRTRPLEGLEKLRPRSDL
jgi:hypothetical protein